MQRVSANVVDKVDAPREQPRSGQARAFTWVGDAVGVAVALMVIAEASATLRHW